VPAAGPRSYTTTGGTIRPSCCGFLNEAEGLLPDLGNDADVGVSRGRTETRVGRDGR
jgi:hypothetical protein